MGVVGWVWKTQDFLFVDIGVVNLCYDHVVPATSSHRWGDPVQEPGAEDDTAIDNRQQLSQQDHYDFGSPCWWWPGHSSIETLTVTRTRTWCWSKRQQDALLFQVSPLVFFGLLAFVWNFIVPNENLRWEIFPGTACHALPSLTYSVFMLSTLVSHMRIFLRKIWVAFTATLPCQTNSKPWY